MALITDFKAAMKFGGARNNQFKILMTLPSFKGALGPAFPNFQAPSGSATGDGSYSPGKMQMLCRATNLPGQTLTEIPVAFRGRQIFLAGDRSFDDAWTTTFFNDADFGVRTTIERWMNAINELAEATGVVDPAEYQTDLYVQHLDRDDKILKEYKFISAWPTTISQIDLAAEQATEIETFDVTWRYMHFITGGVGTGGDGPLVKESRG